MVFSLFGRKEKSEVKRSRTAMPARVPDTTVRGPATAPSIEAQRELARLTAEKIDQIESEMIPGAASTGTAPTLPMHAGRRPAAALPPLEVETAAVFDRHISPEPAIEVNDSALPPEFEEAAILFANAQPDAAVATLREVIARGGTDALALQAFRMLFDVLVVLGAREEYEARAIDFAARFERSPPPWPTNAVNETAAAPKAGTTIRFTPMIDGGGQRVFEQGRRACAAGKAVTLDFSQVATIDAEGAEELCSLVTLLEQGTGDVTVAGIDALNRTARAAIEVGRRDESDAIWRVALLALRVLGDQQGFDDLAIDYCVTFELSPPAWEPLRARFRNGAKSVQKRDRHGADERHPPEARQAHADSDSFALAGELTGLITTELTALREHAGSRSQVSICCRKLVRLDFVAAGELLNELVALAAQGKVALFDHPSAIVETLLSVMGIAELAEVRPRPH